MGQSAFRKKFPKFILILVFTELWERFSYFGMNMIVFLYMTNEMGLTDEYAYGISSLFNAFANYFPIISGALADRYFGFATMILVGGLVVALGHFMMFLAAYNNLFFFWGCSAICVGTGFFRGNILNLLGSSYDTDPKMDRVSGFTLFYASVNLGAFTAALTSGYISTYVSYHFAFSLAGIGMLVGLAVFYTHMHLYYDKDVVRDREWLNKKLFWFVSWPHLLFVTTLIITIPVAGLLYVADFISKYNLVVYVIIPIVAVLVYIYWKLKDQRDRRNYIILLIYFLFLMVFFAHGLQLGNILPAFVDRNVYKYIGPIPVPAPVSNSINPGLIMIIGFVTSTFTNHNDKFDLYRIAYGTLSNSLCFLILRWGAINANPETALTSYIYPIFGIALMALGEILMTPLIQAATTQYSPRGLKGVMMGLYMCMMGFAGLTGFLFADVLKVPQDENGSIDPFKSLEVYIDGFLTVALVNFCFFVLSLIAIPVVKWLRKPTALEKKKIQINQTSSNTVSV